MKVWINLIQNYIFIGLTNFSAMITLSFLIGFSDIIFPFAKKFFLSTTLSAGILIIAESFSTYFEQDLQKYMALDIICNVITFLVSPFIPLFAMHVYKSTLNKFELLFLIPIVVNTVLSVTSPFNGLIFGYINGKYTRGPFFSIFIIASLSSFCLYIFRIIRQRKMYQSIFNPTFIILNIFILSGTMIQCFYPTIHTACQCLSIAILIYYLYYCELMHRLDSVTMLFNRHAFDCRIQALKRKKKATIIIFDVNDFKTANDTYGHLYGDQCLAITSTYLKESFYHIGLCYRFGGDEFSVICKTTDEKTIKKCLNNFIQKLDKHRDKIMDIPYIAYGYAMYEKSKCTVEQAIANADSEMYKSKKRKKDKIKEGAVL